MSHFLLHSEVHHIQLTWRWAARRRPVAACLLSSSFFSKSYFPPSADWKLPPKANLLVDSVMSVWDNSEVMRICVCVKQVTWHGRRTHRRTSAKCGCTHVNLEVGRGRNPDTPHLVANQWYPGKRHLWRVPQDRVSSSRDKTNWNALRLKKAFSLLWCHEGHFTPLALLTCP